ncbi:MAG: DUF438 domain-containing protein [Dehalococcoidia bacterium]|nr:DUF438 domain-containing protein [Dehalococcoidia bacterium]
MAKDLTGKAKKDIMKGIILELHKGLPVEQAKERFEKEIGNISSTEIAEIEQALINDGLTPEEITKFCNVHALIFQSGLEKAATDETFPSHPVYLFRLENREVEKLLGSIKDLVNKKKEYKIPAFKAALKDLLTRLKEIDIHYERKEQLLFPFLEKYGFMGPSKVMWGKDNEVRDLIKKALAGIEDAGTNEALDSYVKISLNIVLEEVDGMIFKEENILFPAALEKLNPGDWVDILKESDDIGYIFIRKPAETEEMIKALSGTLLEEPAAREGTITLPTGTFQPEELMCILNTLPFDLTFVDKDDTVRYFSEGKDRVFRRTKAVIGRKVQNCHPPQSLEVVEKIVASFKEGKKDSYDFWINLQGSLVYIRYFALRDRDGHYLGTVEVTQDIGDIKKIEGERRLIDERD